MYESIPARSGWCGIDYPAWTRWSAPCINANVSEWVYECMSVGLNHMWVARTPYASGIVGQIQSVSGQF